MICTTLKSLVTVTRYATLWFQRAYISLKNKTHYETEDVSVLIIYWKCLIYLKKRESKFHFHTFKRDAFLRCRKVCQVF